MNKPKLVSSPTIKRVKDRQFYEMIIKDAKRILPMVDEYRYLCLIDGISVNLKAIVTKVTKVNNTDDKAIDIWKSFKRPETPFSINYNGSPDFKSDRVFLLKEIIRYCKHRLNELSTTTNIKQ